MNKFARIFLFCLLTWAVALVAQAQSTTANEQAAATDRKAADSETLIPSGSKVFVAPMEGGETYLGAWQRFGFMPSSACATRRDDEMK